MLSKLPAYTILPIAAHRHTLQKHPGRIQMAVEHGAHGIELDAKLCADGHVIVLHDELLIAPNGKGKAREIPLKHLKLLDAGGWFDSQFAGEQIPTLEEVFKTIGDRCTLMWN
jgi:glycerophosphoryl diester phosphodiesterase